MITKAYLTRKVVNLHNIPKGIEEHTSDIKWYKCTKEEDRYYLSGYNLLTNEQISRVSYNESLPMVIKDFYLELLGRPSEPLNLEYTYTKEGGHINSITEIRDVIEAQKHTIIGYPGSCQFTDIHWWFEEEDKEFRIKVKGLKDTKCSPYRVYTGMFLADAISKACLELTGSKPTGFVTVPDKLTEDKSEVQEVSNVSDLDLEIAKYDNWLCRNGNIDTPLIKLYAEHLYDLLKIKSNTFK